MASTERKDVAAAEQRSTLVTSRLHKMMEIFVMNKKGAKSSLNSDPVNLPPISQERLEQSRCEKPLSLEEIASIVREDQQSEKKDHTFLYLAYGSNLCFATFQKARGVTPLAQLNVLVPELRLTFDLPGIPYMEPCFANSATREIPHGNTEQQGQETEKDDKEDIPLLDPSASTSDDPSPPPPPYYHKDRWTKGMVGVVYEVSAKDYYHIIATEGGGSSYQDILVDCHDLSNTGDTVPEKATGKPFKSHTLFAPADPPSEPSKPPPSSSQQKRGFLAHLQQGRLRRPDKSYAQPSPRYLSLLHVGADEHSLPQEYKDYLHQIRPFRVTSQAQQLGLFIFQLMWLPFVVLIFSLGAKYRGKDGRNPIWIRWLQNALFLGMWTHYDYLFKPLFGDGERTQDDEEVARRKERELTGSPRIRRVV